MFKIEEDYWWLSYDSGETWTKLDKAKGDKGDKGDSMFKSVTQDDNKAYLTLADETVITIHKENSDFERIIKDNMVMVFTLDKHDIFIEPGHSELITATTSPFSTSKVTWESSNEEIVTVSDGVVEAHGLGYAIITAIAADKIQTCNVLVAKKGTIPYSFSVSSTQKVFFSKGNLQYQASTEIWRFAEHQYDMIGNGNSNISNTYDDWIDLFGFGTGDNPTISSTNSSDYSKFVEWGKNVISNGGNDVNQWRTLKGEEWGVYLPLTCQCGFFVWLRQCEWR